MYKVTYSKGNRYVKAVVTGNRTTNHKYDMATIWIKIAEYCKTNSENYLLVVSKLHGPIDLLSSYYIAVYMENLRLSFFSKIAFVDENKESFEVNKITSIFCKVNIKYFDNLNEAIIWITDTNIKQ